jgi:hypothetical protein
MPNRGRGNAPKMSDEQIALCAPRIIEMEMLPVEQAMTQEQMASALGLTLFKLKQIKQSDHFQKLFERMKRKREHAAENVGKQQAIEIRKRLAMYSEEAIEAVVELMRNGKNENVRLTAACEIIDRDGRFAKVSRMMNVGQGADGAPMMPEDVSAEILAALQNVKGTVQ